jgi:hypothetical protein
MTGKWWARRDLNPRPPACKAGALPTELRAHFQNHSIKTGRDERIRTSDLRIPNAAP